MNIISSFHDYYDSILAYGQNSDIPFIRKEQIFSINDARLNSRPKIILDLWRMTEVPNSISNFVVKRRFAYNIEFAQNKNYKVYFTPFRVVFCGEIYGGVKVQVNDLRIPFNDADYSKTYFFYNLEEFLFFINEKDVMLEKPTWFTNAEYNDTLKSYFDGYISDKNVLIENKISIAIRIDDKIIVNGKLNDYGFYKVFDPYQTFQILEQWLNGVLAYPPNPMLDIEDKYRVAAHGFDTKYGFRKRPEEKKTKKRS